MVAGWWLGLGVYIVGAIIFLDEQFGTDFFNEWAEEIAEA